MNKSPAIESYYYVNICIFFGKLLPFADVWSDVRLGIHLFVNGHKKWAFSVLAPVIVNTFFTLVLCREMEKKKSRKRQFINFGKPQIFGHSVGAVSAISAVKKE